MNLADIKLVYVVSCVILGVLILSPALLETFSFPEGETFSELYLLNSDGLAEGYPFNVAEGMVYTVVLGVGNRMGGLESYLVYVKLGNLTDPLPDSEAGLPSALSPVLEYRFFLADAEAWEKEISFSFDGVVFEENVSKVAGFIVDDGYVDVEKFAEWNQDSSGFYYRLFFELWIYNSATSSFSYHNRSVGLRLNMTSSL